MMMMMMMMMMMIMLMILKLCYLVEKVKLCFGILEFVFLELAVDYSGQSGYGSLVQLHRHFKRLL